MKPVSASAEHSSFTRRHCLQAAGLASLAALGGPLSAARQASAAPLAKPGFKLGLASYTLRKFDLQQCLEMCKRVGLEWISLKSFHLPLDINPTDLAAAQELIMKSGIKLYGGGVITMRKPEEVEQGFAYARAAGMSMIIGAPSVEMLPAVNQQVKETGIAMAIHNHGPGDKIFPTPESVYELIKSLDPRIGLCIDIGHTVRVGADLLKSVEAYHDRLLDVHIKDVTAADPKGQGTVVGRGVIDIPAFLESLIAVNYNGVVAFEYEEEADDPLPGLAQSVGYVQGVMAML